MPSQRFRPNEHLRRPADFQRVYQRRCSAGSDGIVVYVDKNELNHNRLGLSASKKLGNAVVRNRVRRLLREAYRLTKAELPSGFDIVIVPKRPDLPEFKLLLVELPALIEKALKRCAKSM